MAALMCPSQEWGNPNEAKYFDYMLSYSPYDNVRQQPYPAMLITGGLNDPRVSAGGRRGGGGGLPLLSPCHGGGRAVRRSRRKSMVRTQDALSSRAPSCSLPSLPLPCACRAFVPVRPLLRVPSVVSPWISTQYDWRAESRDVQAWTRSLCGWRVGLFLAHTQDMSTLPPS